MNIKKFAWSWLTAVTLLGVAFPCARAALPADFPGIVVSNYHPAAVSPGCVFLAVASELPDVGVYWLIVTNDGSIVHYEKVDAPEIYDLKMQPNGHLSCAPFIEDHSWTGGGDAVHQIWDENYVLRETVTGGNGYVAESHDFQLLPNGHVLQFGYYMSEVDVSQFVDGGHPAARVSGGVVQELDSNRKVVFQWRTWDHYDFADEVTSKSAVINAFHLNNINLDPDGHLILGTPAEVKKINRQTGEVMWTLGGPDNEFTPIGPGAEVSHFGGHGTYRLENGNFLMYDNGPRQGTGTSKVHEYTLDEVAKTATHVWSWSPPTNIKAWHRGNAQRLPNGNTLIGWGGASGAAIPTCTEVSPAGEIVFEIYFTNSLVESYRAFRFDWPPVRKTEFTEYELAMGNTYTFTNTGVSLEVLNGGGNYNNFTIAREPYAPVDPAFAGKAPRVLPLRVKLSESGMPNLSAQFSFDALSFGFKNPTNLTVYHRAQAGQGIFLPQTSVYNPVTKQLRCLTTLNSSGGDCGEFVFGFPDLPDVAYPPLLAEAENYRGVQTHEVVAPKLATPGVTYSVNQERPILLSWSPKGFARYFKLQVATNPAFGTADLVVDEEWMTEARFIYSNAAPNTTCFYRVRTTVENPDGSFSDGAWSASSFQTVAPTIRVTAPNGGEAWQRGTSCFVRWDDNLAEDVVIDLYKGGSWLRSLDTNSSAGAFAWEVDLDLAPGTDYSIRVSSVSNPAQSDISDANFSIVDAVEATIATEPAGLKVTVDGSDYTAPAVFSWVPGSIHAVEAPSPQAAPDGHSRQVFNSWSDAGAQAHEITAPTSAASYTATFAAQYRLDVAVNPTGAGTVTNDPAGPWYDAGQLVSLTARTNSGYRFEFWQGIDTAASNTAQVTMNEYRTVQATFQPANFPYVVVTNSDGVAPGHLIGNIGGRNADGTRTTYVILDNTGTNALFTSTTQTLSRFSTPQGFNAVASGGRFNLKDETFAVVETVTTLGPTLDTHDIELWPNGHTLLFAQEFRMVDMSQVVPGGKPNANVTGNVIQELDANQRVVFQWHTFDHIPITNTFADMTQASFDYAHINNVTIDPTDNNLLASLRTTSEIVKINRRTGQVMWRLGGKMNMFTFIGEHEENAPYYTVGQHDVHRLANGNLLYFDNGNISGGGITPNDRDYSRMVEYALDETNMTATLVWEYRHTPDIQANCTGSLKRMPNGNTFIDWGCAVAPSGYIVTEVNPAGDVVFEMRHRQTGGISSVLLGGGLLKQFWNNPELVRSATCLNVQSGQTCTAAEAGVSVTVNRVTGPAENELVVTRRLDAVRFPRFPGKAPQVLMEHVVLSSSNLSALEAELDLNLPDTSYVFDTPIIHDPAEVTVYHRVNPGAGEFVALPTTYDSGTRRLRVTTTQLGEFIFGYPDVDETPNVPTIASPEDQSDVNQAAPVTLSWKPQGLVGSFDLQVATDAGFANIVLETNGLGSTSFSLENPLPETQHFWRVRVVNQGGTSAWASASFTTVAPVLQLTYPAGGEVWQRFQVVTIRWNDNLSENVALDMYKGGVSNRTFAANIASSGSYTWTVGQFQAFPPGSDYTIRIRSRTNPDLFDFSEPFSIAEPPVIDGASVARLSDGRVQFEFAAAGMSQASVWGSTNLVDWVELETVPLTNGRAVFTDESAAGMPTRFYRVTVP